MQTAANPIANHLIALLGTQDGARLIGECDEVELVVGDVLAEPGQQIEHVIFPIGGFISLLAPMGGPSLLEVGLTGNEGMYGVSNALGAEASQVHAMVMGSGPALRIGIGAGQV